MKRTPPKPCSRATSKGSGIGCGGPGRPSRRRPPNAASSPGRAELPLKGQDLSSQCVSFLFGVGAGPLGRRETLLEDLILGAGRGELTLKGSDSGVERCDAGHRCVALTSGVVELRLELGGPRSFALEGSLG